MMFRHLILISGNHQKEKASVQNNWVLQMTNIKNMFRLISSQWPSPNALMKIWSLGAAHQLPTALRIGWVKCKELIQCTSRICDKYMLFYLNNHSQKCRLNVLYELKQPTVNSRFNFFRWKCLGKSYLHSPSYALGMWQSIIWILICLGDLPLKELLSHCSHTVMV